MHEKALNSTYSSIMALLAPTQAPVVIEAPYFGVHMSPDYSICKAALLSLHVVGSVVTACFPYNM